MLYKNIFWIKVFYKWLKCISWCLEMEVSNITEDDQVAIRRRRMPRQVSMISDASEKNKSFREWLASIFTMSDTDIISRCGLDALQYLRFQRHIICYVTMTMVLTISIILPLNFQGKKGHYQWLINTAISFIIQWNRLVFMHFLFQ